MSSRIENGSDPVEELREEIQRQREKAEINEYNKDDESNEYNENYE